ncbi:uncharacterized protein LOC121733355 isoform X2 [Aricia agestis]|uniref:uncharacterized protein LOC121733355 isoform X2 n=1 Tax=Aricia agestis TaxID=91739 RepID=UPI001C20A728|nr:uncharacterized protein LOC121733355 isoform X2 [Aricia agestis]
MWVKVCACVVLILGLSHGFLDDAVEVIKLGKEIGEDVLASWEIFGKGYNVTGGVELPFGGRRRERAVLARLAQITRAIQRVESELVNTRSLSLLLASAGRGTRLELRLLEASDLLARVGAAEAQMREYVRYQEQLERSTLESFALWAVSPDRGALPGLVERIHALVAPPTHAFLDKGILALAVDSLQQEQADLCELQLSPHQVVYDMYNTIALAEIKAYAMMQFSWMLLRVYARGNYSQEANLTRKRYAERTARTAALARSALTMARRDVYRCNPDNHVAGETYAEVTRLLQGYIENEVDLNGDGTCKENCPYYTVAASHSCYDPHGYCNVQKRCTGRIVNCQYIDSDMWVCPASRSNNRRYEFIEYENGRVLGKPGHCRLGTTKVDSWWRVVYHCSYCFCLCEETVGHERTFSLREAGADIDNNKVVTGVRLVKHGQVFHLQVSEGHLGPRGNVTPGGWVPVQRFAITDKGVREGEDYHTLTYERRAIDLDELEAPVGRVLTGVRFRMIGAHLHFEIRATMFNYTTGRLAPLHSEWISNDNTDVGDTPRKKLELIRPDIPIRGNVPLQIDSAHDQFVEFTHSDLDADAAQSTVPFLDIQPVQPARGAGLLTGAGVYHRGALHSGGFLGLKVISYDMTRHIRADPPPAGYDDDDEESNVLPSDVQ